MDKNQLRLVQSTSSSKFLPHFILAPIIAILIIVIGQILGQIILYLMFSNIMDKAFSMSLLLILETGVPIYIVFLWVRFIEKRPFSTIGFYKSGRFLQYIKGFLIGFLMFSVVIVLLSVSGFTEWVQKPLYAVGISAIPSVLIMLLGWMVQGASEEILTRGWLMNVLIARYNIPFGLILSSTLFGALHLLNDHVSYIAILNIILIGLFFGLYALKTDNIWGACGAHSAWNWAQGNVFGLNVSGITINTGSLIQMKLTGLEIITGGSFGPEGGLVVSFVTTLSIVIVYRLPWKSIEI